MSEIQNTEDFLGLFQFAEDEIANLDVVRYRNAEDIGFSVKIEYPNDLLFRPAITSAGKIDSIALIHIALMTRNVKDNKIPLVLRIGKASRYLLKDRWDYDFTDPTCPTKESVINSEKSVIPSSLESYRDYYYNNADGKIYKSDIAIEPIKMIYELFEQHCRTARLLEGLTFRAKVKARKHAQNFSLFLVSGASKSTEWVLVKWLGREIDKKDSAFVGSLKPYSSKHIRKKESSKISIFGTELFIIQESFIFACVFMCIAYPFAITPVCWLIQIGVLSANQLMWGVYFVVYLFIFDHFLPRILLWLCNLLIAINVKTAFLKINAPESKKGKNI